MLSNGGDYCIANIDNSYEPRGLDYLRTCAIKLRFVHRLYLCRKQATDS